MTSLSVLMPIGAATSTDKWRSRSLCWLKSRYEALLPDAEMVFGVDMSPTFNRSAARNDAFARSSGDVLLIADADTVFNVDQIDAGLALIDAGAPWVLPYRSDGGYVNLTQQATLAVLASDPGAYVAEPSDPGDWELRLTSWAGLLLVPLAAYACVGGYDERFASWGGEDNAFALALDQLAGPHERVDAALLHLWHARNEGDFANPGWPANEVLLNEYRAATTPEAMLQVIARTDA